VRHLFRIHAISIDQPNNVKTRCLKDLPIQQCRSLLTRQNTGTDVLFRF